MKLLITAGPTREPIDAVRYLSNRSSGRMGLALAQAALAAGHEVALLLGPVGELHHEKPVGYTVKRFETGAELRQLLRTDFSSCDVLVMAAAVADYRAKGRGEKEKAGKIARSEQGLTLALEPTPDLVAELAGRKKAGQRIIAFALEEAGVMEARAQEKLARKGVDAIVANPLATMDAEAIEAVVLTAGGERVAPGKMSKGEFARWLIAWLGKSV
ncbi:MAG: hypothetical protein IT443_12560 [Phycisphaeraceae bacterium]|nr:hypothetical protein [Phycisphaeraceae bacterium]